MPRNISWQSISVSATTFICTRNKKIVSQIVKQDKEFRLRVSYEVSYGMLRGESLKETWKRAMRDRQTYKVTRWAPDRAKKYWWRNVVVSNIQWIYW